MARAEFGTVVGSKDLGEATNTTYLLFDNSPLVSPGGVSFGGLLYEAADGYNAAHVDEVHVTDVSGDDFGGQSQRTAVVFGKSVVIGPKEALRNIRGSSAAVNKVIQVARDKAAELQAPRSPYRRII